MTVAELIRVLQGQPQEFRVGIREVFFHEITGVDQHPVLTGDWLPDAGELSEAQEEEQEYINPGPIEYVVLLNQ